MPKQGFGRPGWTALVGALLVGQLVLGCGGTSNVLASRGGTGAAGNLPDGGVDTGGTGSGRGGNSGNAGSGAVSGTGSSTAGGGTAAAGGDGHGGVTGADAGGSGTAAAGGASGFNPPDPHAAERKQLSDDLCAVLNDYPCLDYLAQRSESVPGATTAQKISQCTHDLQVVEGTIWADPCFAEWAQEMKCLTALPRQCPCVGNDCELGLPGSSPSPCPGEAQALLDCTSKNPPGDFGDVTGTHGKCSWFRQTNGTCSAACGTIPANGASLGARCDGSPAGAQGCYCDAAGVPLYDWKPGDNSHGVAFYADNCMDVGQQMADGACTEFLNCCFTWIPKAEAGTEPVQQCSCTSDPKALGYDSCEALATEGGGKVVTICPQFLSGSQPPFP